MSAVTSYAEATYRARLFVFGAKMHSKTERLEHIPGEWHPRFHDHPWVRASITEGWDRELRSHCVMAVARRMIEGRDFREITDLMPDQKWVDDTRKQAAVYRSAKEWRDRMEAEYGSMDDYYKAVKHMPRWSDFQPLKAPPKADAAKPSTGFIRQPFKRIDPDDSDMTLTERSRAMQGDREEYDP